jgi:nucleotide-binding universal stress UspA family protein
MLRSIVVPIDGSRIAERAIPVAARIAKAHDAVLHLVLAQEPTQGLSPFGEFGPPSVLVIEELDRQHSAYLERTARRLRKAGVRTRTLLEDGAPGRVITQAVQSRRAKLVVMSTHGHGALGRLGLGSVCDYTVRHLQIPVLLVPREARIPRGVPGRRVLVPLDLSPQSLVVLDAIEELVGAAGRLTLLHVIQPVGGSTVSVIPFASTFDASLTDLQWDRARSQMEILEAKSRRRGFRVNSNVLTGIRPAAVILDQLHRGSYDLAAMTTHGYGGFRRLLLGSITNTVIRNARKPVLVVRPKARVKSLKPSRRLAAAGK